MREEIVPSPLQRKALTVLMAAVCGITVANLYYIQPLEQQIAATFHVSQSAAGIAATLTQLGYAFGLLFFVPLGDIRERRSLILRMLLFVGVSLFAVAASPAYAFLLIAVFAMGITTVVPQMIVPFSAHLAKPEESGKTIGNVMSGLLIGILLSRTFSGFAGGAFGWRAVYFFAAGLTLTLMILIRVKFPQSEPTSKIRYRELLRTIPHLIRTERTLREASLNGLLLFGAFSAFWTTLIFLLESPVYSLGPREAGLFGLAGAAGALAAPLVGKAADKRSPRFTVGIGIALYITAFLCFLFFGRHIWGLIAGVVMLDLGAQCGQISNMARVQALGDEVRNRNNSFYMFAYFVGGSAGSLTGSLCYARFGWTGVCIDGLLFLLAALAAQLFYSMYRK